LQNGDDMTDTLSLATLLARSDRLHSAWQEALEPTDSEDDLGLSLRDSLALDACALTLEHGQAMRQLVSSQLEASAMTLLRVQHEALLRAIWLLYAASEANVDALAAPRTMATLKKANNLPLTHDLLDQVEKSDAPEVMKRNLRQFRDQSWAGMNSYTHAGLLALGRIGSGHPESHLVQTVQVSNAHSYSACMIMARLVGPEHSSASINVIALAHPGCMVLVNPANPY
jgi:hypothetical protein